MAGFFEEVKRRKVYRVAAAYVIAAGGMIQLASAAFPAWELPNWALRLVIVLLLIGFPIALILAWAFDVTPSGIQTTPPIASSPKGRRRNLFVLVTTGIVVSAAASFFLLPRAIAHKVDKSIAVLPFENLSADKENAYFADGVQDELLTNLSKIGDLRVISRTSVMKYRGQTSNIREIGKALGVATILEGSVQRSGNQVRITVQLIDTANVEQHLWAQVYDGNLTDVFKVQTEFAEKIASALKAQLSPDEKAQLNRTPTEVGDALTAFQEAHNLHSSNPEDLQKLKEAEAKYAEAIRLDPKFPLALAYYSYLESWIYHSFEHTSERREKARSLAQQAMALDSSLPEAHLAQGFVLYYADSDFEGAAREFEIARNGLPNQPEVYLALGAIKRRQGKWAESNADLMRAVKLNPNDAWTLHNLAVNYEMQRDYKAANETVDSAIAINPKDPTPWEIKLKLFIDKADFDGALRAVDQFKGSLRPEVEIKVSLFRMNVLLLARRFQEALVAAEQIPDSMLANEPADRCSKYATIGLLKRNLHDEEGAHAAFLQGQQAAQAHVGKDPEDPFGFARLALVEASLGNKDAAIVAIERAKKILPESKDAFNGPDVTEVEAQVYALLGDSPRAISILSDLLQKPSPVNVALLKINPIWDSLRTDPAFQKLISDHEPKA